jgi:hypothetical protein
VNEALANPSQREWLAKIRKQQPDTAGPDLALVRAPR